MAIFNPLQNQHPSSDHQKIYQRWSHRRPKQLCQIWWVGFSANLWNITKFLFIYLYLYFGNSSIGQTRRQIFMDDGSNDADFCKDVPIWVSLVSLIWLPYRGSNHPQKPQFWEWIGISKQNSPNQKTLLIIETTAPIRTKSCTVIKTIKCSLWVVQTHSQQIQDGGLLPEWKIKTTRSASAVRTARHQFQATGQPVSWTQASDAMTSPLLSYEAKCVQRTKVLPMRVGPFEFRYQENGATPRQIYWYHSKGNWVRYNFCRWQFLYNETL